MKKFFIIMLAVIIAVAMSSMAFVNAGTTTSLDSAHSTALAKLTDPCGYYGWCTDDMEVKSTNKTKTTTFEATVLYNSKTYRANFKVKTVKASKAYKTTYYTGGKSYSLSGIKRMLSKYSSATGRASTVKKSTIDISDEIIDLAQDYDWTVKTTARTEKEDKYSQTIKFSNEKYSWTAKVITKRDSKNKKLVVSYKRNGANSSRAAIEEWLEKYAV